ncbi:outer membrane protein assembly factor BamB family protein [Natrarchaeobius halalkaliphilus]|nr:PQQ-like beta-propeller repeat protein [Natrarchaeobius halalkaliphilus]
MVEGQRKTRRKWLSLCGGTVTGATILSGCADEDEQDRKPTDHDDGTDTGDPRSAGDWPMFGADLQNTGYQPDADGPTDDVTVRWTLEGGEQFNASPVVADGTVYAGCWDETLYAVDAATGEIEWEQENLGLISSSPTVVNETVYLSTSSNDIYAFAVNNGEIRWKEEFDRTTKNPIPVDRTVYALDPGRLVSTVGSSGETTVVLDDLGGAPEAPAIDDDVLYIGGNDSARFYDLESFELTWEFKNPNSERMSDRPPAIAENVAYISGSDSKVYAIDVKNKEQKWTYELNERTPSGPSVADGVVYFGSWNNYLYAIDAETSEKEWKYDCGTILAEKPTVTAETVYMTGGDTVYAVDISTGEEEWSFTTENNETITGSPVVTDDALYIPSRNNHLYALEEL